MRQDCSRVSMIQVSKSKSNSNRDKQPGRGDLKITETLYMFSPSVEGGTRKDCYKYGEFYCGEFINNC